jgi:hypothetical protein
MRPRHNPEKTAPNLPMKRRGQRLPGASGRSDPGPHRLPAGMIEEVVVDEIRALLRTPDIASRTVQALRREGTDIDEADVLAAITGFDGLWRTLFPVEQAHDIPTTFSRKDGRNAAKTRNYTQPTPKPESSGVR